MSVTPATNTGQVGSNKAIAGGSAGALVTVVVWAIGTWTHVTIPAEVAAALTTLVATAAVYLVPHGGSKA